MINETHTVLIRELASLFPQCKTSTDILRRSLRNYRSGKGMSLTFDAFKFLDDEKIYTFVKIPRPRYLNSKELVLFDTLSETPYYIGLHDIYISDTVHAFTFTLVQTFEAFVEFLKE